MNLMYAMYFYTYGYIEKKIGVYIEKYIYRNFK